LRTRDKINLAIALLNVAIGAFGILYVPEQRSLATGWVVLWTLLAIATAIPRLRRYVTWRR
jgi:hypothetical protein